MRASKSKVASISKISNHISVIPPASCCHWCEWCQGHVYLSRESGDLKDVNIMEAKQSKVHCGVSPRLSNFSHLLSLSRRFSR